jgi:hypothetical protein
MTIKNNKFVTSTDIVKLINKYGVENIIAIIPLKPLHTVLGLISYTDSSDAEIKIPCKIIEDRYPIVDNYKIEFQALIGGFGKESFYLMDFATSVQKGYIQLCARII